MGGRAGAAHPVLGPAPPIARRRRDGRRRAGFGLAWLIQFKGFPDHSIPATGYLMIALGFFFVENRARLAAPIRVAAPAILLMPLVFTAWYGPYRNDFTPIVQPMLRGVGAHDSVAFVSDQAIFSWPLSLYPDVPFPSRQYSMLLLRAVAFDHGRTPAVITWIGREIVEETAQDYRCAQPVRIIFSRKPVDGFMLEDYFLAAPAFADLMRHYHSAARYLIFERPFARPPAPACRRSF